MKQRVQSGVPFVKKNLLSNKILIEEGFGQTIHEERQSQPSQLMQRPKTSGNNTAARRNFMKTVDVKKPTIFSGTNIFASRKLSGARRTGNLNDMPDLLSRDSPKKQFLMESLSGSIGHIKSNDNKSREQLRQLQINQEKRAQPKSYINPADSIQAKEIDLYRNKIMIDRVNTKRLEEVKFKFKKTPEKEDPRQKRISDFMESLKLLEYTPVLTRIKQELNNEPMSHNLRLSENKHQQFKKILKDYQQNSLQ